jgi:hypothetical protein
MTTFRLSALAVLVLGLVSVVSAADPTGTWKFTAEGPRGHAAESTLVLNYANNQLSGTIDNRAGKAEITAGSFANDTVAFNVHREFGRRLRKQKIDVHYQGKLEGNTIIGTIETTGRDHKPISAKWEAHRVK